MAKKRVSKKSKTSWRKHSDVKDVELHLEDVRLDERLGGKFSDRADTELFKIDTQPENAVKADNSFRSIQAKRKVLKARSLKCVRVIRNNSAVQDPISKRNRVKTNEEQHPVATKRRAELLKQGIVSKTETLQIKNRKFAAEKIFNDLKKRSDAVAIDLWSEEGKQVNKNNPFGEAAEWLTNPTIAHNVMNTGKWRATVPKSVIHKLSHVAAVEPPHPGSSYNPTLEDHQDLLKEVMDAELKLIKEEERMKRVTSNMFSRTTVDNNTESWMTEMSEGLPSSIVKQEKESDDEGDYKAINPPVKNKKKPLKKIRKLKEIKAEKTRIKKTKEEKKKWSDVLRLTVLKKEIVKVDDKVEMLREKREKVKQFKAKDTRQLSRTKFTPAELDFNMAEDIAGTMRSLKPEGNLIIDRFKSLQRRNIVAPTPGKALPKYGKYKKFERSTHKMGWEPKGY